MIDQGSTNRNNSPWPQQSNSKLYEPAEIILAAGATTSFNISPQSPERWIVSIGAAAGVKVNVYVGPNPTGRFFALYGGGKAKIPADNDAISFANVGANTATIQVIASRGYDFIDIDCGEIV